MTRLHAPDAGRILRFALAIPLVVVTGLAPSPVRAQHADPAFPIVHGRVYASALHEGTLYLGGQFTRVGPNSGAFGFVDAVTGGTTPTPRVEGTVYAIAPDLVGGFYLGGAFQSVGGVPRSNLAYIRADGSLDPWNPGADAPVYAIQKYNQYVYVGGAFENVGGAARRHVAALGAATGLALGWNADADSVVYALWRNALGLWIGGRFDQVGGQPRAKVALVDGGTGAVQAWSTTVAASPGQFPAVTTLALDAGTIYVGGVFASIGGLSRRNLAALRSSTGLANGWDPAGTGYVSVNAIVPGGTTVLLAGSFAAVGGQPRACLAKVDAGTGAATAWNPGADGPVRALQVVGQTVYVGGGFSVAGGLPRPGLAAVDLSTGAPRFWDPAAQGDVYALAVASGVTDRIAVGGGLMSLGAVTRQNLAAIDIATGEVTPWNPGASSWVNAMSVGGSSLYLGGSFTIVGGVGRNGFAAVDLASGVTTAWNPPAPNSTVECVAAHGNTVYVGGGFTDLGGTTRNHVAALDASTGALTAWNPSADNWVRTVAARDGRVFVGGMFGTLGGASRANLGAVDSVTGSALPWVANAANAVECVVPDDQGRLYVGGWFDAINGTTRHRIARLDAASGALDAWNPGDGGVVDHIVPAGSQVFASGILTSMGGQSAGGAARIDAATGTVAAWDPQLNYEARTLAESGGVVYAGGDLYRAGALSLLAIARLFPPDVTPPVPHVVQPNGGELMWAGGDPVYTITWTTDEDQRAPYVDLDYSLTSADGPWSPIASTLPNTGAYDWVFPFLVFSGPGLHANAYPPCWVRVSATDLAGNVGSDASDAPGWISFPTGGVAPIARTLSLSVLPSPMRGAGQVRLALPAGTHVRVAIFDVHGREVARLADGERDAGDHLFPVPGRLAPGLYVVRANAGGETRASKFVVLE